MPPIAVQLYSLREELDTDFDGTMAKVAEMGYIGVEPYGGLDAKQVSDTCQKLGLQITSAHLNLPLGDDQQVVFDSAKTLGIQHIIIPWVTPDTFASLDSIRQFADQMNQVQKACQQAGFTLGYHNHDFEFQLVDGQPAYHAFVEHLSPAIVLEIDTYWVHVSGVDVTDTLKQYASRTPLLHIKDGPGTSDAPMTAIGEGVMDFQAVQQAVDIADWWIVELDRCATDMTQAIQASYTYLTQNGLANGKV